MNTRPILKQRFAVLVKDTETIQCMDNTYRILSSIVRVKIKGQVLAAHYTWESTTDHACILFYI